MLLLHSTGHFLELSSIFFLYPPRPHHHHHNNHIPIGEVSLSTKKRKKRWSIFFNQHIIPYILRLILLLIFFFIKKKKKEKLELLQTFFLGCGKCSEQMSKYIYPHSNSCSCVFFSFRPIWKWASITWYQQIGLQFWVVKLMDQKHSDPQRKPTSFFPCFRY